MQLIPALATLLLHGLIALLIIVGVPGLQQSQELKAKPKVIHAKLVVEKPPPAPPKKAPPPRPAPKPKPKPKPKPEPKPAPKPEPKPEPKPKGPTPEEIRKKKAEEKAREKAREEAKQRALEEQIRRQQEEELAAAIASEDEAIEDAELASTYSDLIADLVQRNWRRPPTARNNMVVVVRFEILPTGEFINPNVVDSSGHPAFDQSALDAIERVGQVQELRELAANEPGVFSKNFRRFTIRFNPTDLRR